MTPSMQGFITALLISLLVGVIIGFYLRQARINALTAALKQSQDREKELEQEHESRLQAATLKLQQDYETQLAEKMAAYQSQYETQLSQMESTYQARQSLIAQGAGGGMAGGNDMAATIEQRIRQQYESRLKEVAHKIQQAYEQHLQAKLVEAREVAQADYDQRLAQVIEHHQDELDQRLAQATPPPVMPMDTSIDPSIDTLEAAAIAATPGPSQLDQPTGASSETVALLEDQLRQEYDQRLAEAIAHHQDEMLQRTQALEADFANRLQLLQAAQPEAGSTGLGEADQAALRAEIEADLRSQYEQQLAEKIEHYQAELSQRTQEMEQSFAARLAMVEQASPGVAPTDELSEELSSALSSLDAAEAQPSRDDFGALLDFDTDTEAPASPRPEDSGFDIDQLDALLNEAVDEYTPPSQLFDDLDDLSSLS